MKKGILIFAHNSEQIDYARLAIISGRLAKKNLNVPVSLITDIHTKQWMIDDGIFSVAEEIFENIIITEMPPNYQHRNLHDGKTRKSVPFKNFNRASAFDLTPYDRTLLIDSDFLIFTDALNSYWEVDQDFLISEKIDEIFENRVGFLSKKVSDVGIPMRWATSIMFTKNKRVETIFKLVDYIRENSNYFSDLYQYTDKVFRNDRAFSISLHTINGFQNIDQYFLPATLTFYDVDDICQINNDGSIKFLVDDIRNGKYNICSISEKDIHIMNKFSIIRNYDKLIKL